MSGKSNLPRARETRPDWATAPRGAGICHLRQDNVNAHKARRSWRWQHSWRIARVRTDGKWLVRCDKYLVTFFLCETYLVTNRGIEALDAFGSCFGWCRLREVGEGGRGEREGGDRMHCLLQGLQAGPRTRLFCVCLLKPLFFRMNMPSKCHFNCVSELTHAG